MGVLMKKRSYMEREDGFDFVGGSGERRAAEAIVAGHCRWMK